MSPKTLGRESGRKIEISRTVKTGLVGWKGTFFPLRKSLVQKG